MQFWQATAAWPHPGSSYEVDQVSVVLPDDVSQIGIDPQGDYVTLLTCTPYGVNSHRLLVRGTRTEWTAEDSAIPATETTNHESSWWSEYRTALCIGFGIYLAMLAVAVPVVIWRNKRGVRHG